MNEASIVIEDAENGIKIAKISGQLDESNVDEKIQDLYKVVEATPKGLKLLFDLENLEYMNSKSIGYLTDLYGKITENGGKVVIAKAKPNIIDILQVVGLTQLINSFDTTEEATAALAEIGSPAPAPEAPAETPAPAPEAPAETPAPAPETPAETPAPAPEAPAETPAPAPEAPAETPAPAPEAPA
ncbi:MAG: anti-sigma factor antagonist, partial [Nitrospirae bacterium]|nr:anti-sigma factor antagonist [Nitrospirota bacterium]